MLPLMLNVLPLSVNAGPPLATASTSIAGLQQGDASAAARQILPNAVAATGAPVAFSPNTPSAPKAPTKTSGNAAATPLAAQLIGQDNALNDQEQTIFHPSPAAPNAADADAQATIDAMRQARGDLAPASAKTTLASGIAAAAEAPILPGFKPETRSVPPGRKPGIGTAQGAGAYRIAGERNARLTPTEKPTEL